MLKSIQRLATFSNLYNNVLLIRKEIDPECTTYASEIIKILREHHVNVYIKEDKPSDLLNMDVKHYTADSHKLIDLMITIGGDGTVLFKISSGMQLYQDDYVPPVLTFGKGTLGFMCIYGLKDYKKKLVEVLNGQTTIEKKNRLHGVMYNHSEKIYSYNALNEFVISKNNYVLTLDIYINNKFVTQTRGDGLILSTPTGSTAYSLSVGGPIVQNEVPCTVIAPICPLSLSFRPIVIPEYMEVKIKMANQSKSEGTIIADGQSFAPFKYEDTLFISKSKSNVRFIHPVNESHFDNWAYKLKRLLNWNSKFSKNEN